MNSINIIYFNSFGVENIPKIENSLGIKILQAYDSIMCGYFWIGFVHFMLKGKILLKYPNLFSPKTIK